MASLTYALKFTVFINFKPRYLQSELLSKTRVSKKHLRLFWVKIKTRVKFPAGGQIVKCTKDDVYPFPRVTRSPKI